MLKIYNLNDLDITLEHGYYYITKYNTFEGLKKGIMKHIKEKKEFRAKLKFMNENEFNIAKEFYQNNFNSLYGYICIYQYQGFFCISDTEYNKAREGNIYINETNWDQCIKYIVPTFYKKIKIYNYEYEFKIINSNCIIEKDGLVIVNNCYYLEDFYAECIRKKYPKILTKIIIEMLETNSILKEEFEKYKKENKEIREEELKKDRKRKAYNKECAALAKQNNIEFWLVAVFQKKLDDIEEFNNSLKLSKIQLELLSISNKKKYNKYEHIFACCGRDRKLIVCEKLGIYIPDYVDVNKIDNYICKSLFGHGRSYI